MHGSEAWTFLHLSLTNFNGIVMRFLLFGCSELFIFKDFMVHLCVAQNGHGAFNDTSWSQKTQA